MQRARIYYDCLTMDERRALLAEMKAGPQPAFEGVCPSASDADQIRIGAKRFADKFHRDPFDDPENTFVEGYFYDRRTIAERLAEDTH
jgi:hypothetical protein